MKRKSQNNNKSNRNEKNLKEPSVVEDNQVNSPNAAITSKTAVMTTFVTIYVANVAKTVIAVQSAAEKYKNATKIYVKTRSWRESKISFHGVL